MFSMLRRSTPMIHSSKACTSFLTMFSSTVNNGGRPSVVSEQESKRSRRLLSFDRMSGSPVKGTRDFYPQDKKIQRWFFSKWTSSAETHGFEEYDAPIVEHESLYLRKAGEEISEQLYNFKDKGDRRLCLRPEMTPSLCRMVLAKSASLSFPIKWFSIPQCWRYEKTTRGRRREHFQWNMDIWGISGVEAEAELLSALVCTLSSLGLSSADVKIKISSRKILDAIMNHVGVPEETRIQTCIVIDKLDKLSATQIESEFLALRLDANIAHDLLHMIKAPLYVLEEVLGSTCPAIIEVKSLLYLTDSGYGLAEWMLFDATTVRGLGYYTGVVFEAFDTGGQFRAICGGGRYDSLSESMGGPSIPAVGFGFGDAVITELLAEKKALPNFDAARGPDVVILVVGSNDYALTLHIRASAARLSCGLRKNNIVVDLDLGSTRLKRALAKASKAQTRLVVIMGADEYERGEVVLKDLVKGTQVVVQYSDACLEIEKAIGD